MSDRTDDMRDVAPEPREPFDPLLSDVLTDDDTTIVERDHEPVDLDVETVGDDDDASPAAQSWWERDVWWARGTRRVFRRPTDWLMRDWPTERIVKVVFTVFALTTTTAIMMNVVHFNPLSPARDLVLDDTTPTGGDFGAHVWGPAFLRDHLLPNLRFNGWSMDWYAGMPTYRFYMVLPALLIVAVDVLVPYGVAMKLVAISGLLTLPAACWAFGRLARFPYPMPELFAFGGLAFALDESFSIYGGNLKSTMAGEFSFSIALSLGVLALGVLAAGLRTGKYRVWASVLIAAACVSHGIVLIFVALSAAVLCLMWVDRRRIVYAATVGITSVLLMIWWVGPFLFSHEYMTDMKYGFRPQGADDSFWDMFFPLAAPLDWIITTLAVIGFAACIARRHLTGIGLGVIGVLLVGMVYVTRDSLPVIGLLWNPRLLPFLYLVRYLLMMVGAVEVGWFVWNALRDRRARAEVGHWPSTVSALATAAGVLVVLGWTFQVLPGDGTRPEGEEGAPVYAWGPFRGTDTNKDAQGDGWSRYNFLGYEGRNEYYTEYVDVVRQMKEIGQDPELGCGRALWENNEDNGKYGTTMALMLLPHWTDGCIGSMEGLFFEASGTTPYHFLATSAMSENASDPVRELRYDKNDAEVGVRHLQDLGVRYAMVRTDDAKRAAAEQPELTLIATSGPWDIYLVENSSIVEPLDVQPVVVEGRPGDGRERNLELGTSWFQHPDEWAAMPADDGPAEWQRISVAVDESRTEGEPGKPGRRVDIVEPVEQIEPVALPEVTVSDVQIEQQSLSFSVDQVGVPVLVRVSYFPNWNVSGAEGPYRIAPNFMVVVPTDTHVELTYGRSTIDWATMLLTLVGIGLCVLWRFRGDVRVDGRPEGQADDLPASPPPPPPPSGPGSDAEWRSDEPWERDPAPARESAADSGDSAAVHL